MLNSGSFIVLGIFFLENKLKPLSILNREKCRPYLGVQVRPEAFKESRESDLAAHSTHIYYLPICMDVESFKCKRKLYSFLWEVFLMGDGTVIR